MHERYKGSFEGYTMKNDDTLETLLPFQAAEESILFNCSPMCATVNQIYHDYVAR